MHDIFVETSNARKFHEALKRVDERGAIEACLVILDGKPGLGKTTTMTRWVAQTGSIKLRAQAAWDYSWFIKELLIELSVTQPIRGKLERFARVVHELGERAEASAFTGSTFGLVIDEADLVSNKGEIMEAIRGLTDIKYMPTVLVGMGRLRENLRKFPQIESRAPNKVEFLPATLEDADALIKGRCEVPVAPDLVEFVWRLSKGFNREILEAIACIERFGRRMEPGPQGVCREDMAGQIIMSDRASGKPILVPGGA